jgi:hypothetical protein
MTITIDGDKFERDLLNVYAKKLAAAFINARAGIATELAEKIRELITSSPEYSSLLTGSLWHQLGVRNPLAMTDAIISTIQESVVIQMIPPTVVGKRIRGGIVAKILKADFSDVLRIPGASFESEHGFEVDWLEWLLTSGDSIVNTSYHFESGFPDRSRTGDGIMLAEGSWRVPPEFAGTISDNWLTRALSGLGDLISDIFMRNIKRGFQ